MIQQKFVFSLQSLCPLSHRVFYQEISYHFLEFLNQCVLQVLVLALLSELLVVQIEMTPLEPFFLILDVLYKEVTNSKCVVSILKTNIFLSPFILASKKYKFLSSGLYTKTPACHLFARINRK